MRQEDALDEAAKRSARAYARELAKVVEASDVVLKSSMRGTRPARGLLGSSPRYGAPRANV